VTIAGFKNRRRKNPPIREVIFVSETSGYFSYKKMEKIIVIIAIIAK